jgi:hypothetical protein
MAVEESITLSVRTSEKLGAVLSFAFVAVILPHRWAFDEAEGAIPLLVRLGSLQSIVGESMIATLTLRNDTDRGTSVDLIVSHGNCRAKSDRCC